MQVHSKGRIGSPRVRGLTRPSKVANNSGWLWVKVFLPPPARRMRGGSEIAASPWTSTNPRRTVLTANPEDRATARTPPQPKTFASAPAHKRTERSFNQGDKSLNRSRTAPSWPVSGTAKMVAGPTNCIKLFLDEYLGLPRRLFSGRPEGARLGFSKIVGYCVRPNFSLNLDLRMAACVPLPVRLEYRSNIIFRSNRRIITF